MEKAKSNLYVRWVEVAMELKMYWVACAVRPWSGKVGSGRKQVMHPVGEYGSGTSGNETKYQ